MRQQEQSEARQKALENFILLVLGASNKKISLLHLEKEVFLLWNFHPLVKDFIVFIQHYRGPYSKEIEDAIRRPFYLENCWSYSYPKNSEDISGGRVELTEKGHLQYLKIYQEVIRNEQMLPILAGMKMVREMYDDLSIEELLLLIYDTYPEYRKKSNVADTIDLMKATLAKGLLKRGKIDSERYDNLVAGN
ncbi:MAG: hypothetical protein Q7V05_07765 [Methanoregula sp.]|nr:hypothetical protein [Methanoregula sp.]